MESKKKWGGLMVDGWMDQAVAGSEMVVPLSTAYGGLVLVWRPG